VKCPLNGIIAEYYASSDLELLPEAKEVETTIRNGNCTYSDCGFYNPEAGRCGISMIQ